MRLCGPTRLISRSATADRWQAHYGGVDSHVTRSGVGAATGLLAAAAAVGVGEIVAAFVRPEASPIIAVGNRMITLTPEPVSRWAIREFGASDKSALLSGIYVVIGLLAIAVGILALRRLWLGLAGLAVFGGVGVYCALTTPAHRTSDVIPTIVATAAGMLVLTLLRATIKRSATTVSVDRRTLLQASGAVAALAALTGFGGRALQHRRTQVTSARAATKLPPPDSPAPPLPTTVDLGKSGQPWITPNADFYRVDTALYPPHLNPNGWSLRVHGMVDHEIKIDYQQLLARPQIERWITLCCVSNEVGGDLIGTARFQGARLADLLTEAGIRPGADQLVMRSSDGMTLGAPVAAIMDGRDALLAVGMNGEPLPVEHGYPVRVIVPGLYGYVSACKWVVDVEASTFAQYDAYWVDQGWQKDGTVQLASRIDTPRSSKSLYAGKPVAVAGVAWEQHVGVGKVEVQIDEGAWQEARLAPTASIDTWRQWVLPWTPEKTGTHKLRVRATDNNGRVQSAAVHEPYPGAASGYHEITVNVRMASA
jgi:DMSO/TMAO reductase YedYZ molybdopterin-dependent catalytic subunit